MHRHRWFPQQSLRVRATQIRRLLLQRSENAGDVLDKDSVALSRVLDARPVASSPQLFKYGFSKRTLARACEGVGIRYGHLPELGIESRRRKGLKTPSDFEALLSAYKRSILPKEEAALPTIRAWLRSGDAVALTCFERDAEQCHRHCVAAAFAHVSGSADHSDGSTGISPDIGDLQHGICDRHGEAPPGSARQPAISSTAAPSRSTSASSL